MLPQFVLPLNELSLERLDFIPRFSSRYQPIAAISLDFLLYSLLIVTLISSFSSRSNCFIFSIIILLLFLEF